MTDQNIYLFKFDFNEASKKPVLVIWKENGGASVSLEGKVELPIRVTRYNGELTQEGVDRVAIDTYPKFIETFCPRGEVGNLDCSSEGMINLSDLDIFIASWKPDGPAPSPRPGRHSADLVVDNKVDEMDMITLLRNWGL